MKPAPSPAAALIAAQQHWSLTPAPSAAALAELRTLCEHNDTTDRGYRVSAAKAVDMLRAMGWSGKGTLSLNRICNRHLGRTSYGSR